MLRQGRWLMLALLVGAVTLCGVSAFATPVGSDITYFDNRTNGGASWWDGGAPDTRDNPYQSGFENVGEDQEVEPAATWIAGQAWDLEGMYYNSGSLSLVGGYNFQAGYGGYQPGDLFLAVNPTLTTPNTAGSVEPPNVTGALYDYAIHFGRDGSGHLTGTYSVYNITGLTTLTTVGDPLGDVVPTVYLQESNGWKLSDTTAASLTALATGTVSFASTSNLVADGYLTPADYYPLGTLHYVMQGIDLTNFGLVPSGSSANIYVHYTYGCGNDDLAGYVRLTDTYDDDPVPEPASLTLLGLGLAAAAAFRLRKSIASRT